MFSIPEVAPILTNKRSKFWPGGGGKHPNRRLISQLMCRRLPILTLWTLIVIFILYKSLSNTPDLKSADPQDTREFRSAVSTTPAYGSLRSGEERVSISLNQFLIRRSSPNYDEKNHRIDVIGDNSNTIKSTSGVITKLPNGRGAIVETTKKSTSEYARQSKVFILIVQNGDVRMSKPNHPYRRSPYHLSSYSTQNVANSNRRLVIPAHIRILIGILESHRIDYTIDTTRTGLPTTLLTDQNSASENRQYSVIIIDDFIKYTKLNRWIRDQLDRHCRTNQIGVVTYLTSDELERQTLDVGQRRTTSRITGNAHILSRNNGAPTTEESLADQFPLSFKPIDQQSCLNLSATNCLVDYQLNERSPILRILKRRRNFILKGPLAKNLNQSPWISMSSNHITYEPLTWAKLRRPNPRYPSDVTNQHASSHSNSTSTTTTRNTQEKDPNSPDVEMRGDVSQYKSGMPKDEYAYGSQDSMSGEYNVTQEYDQLQVVPDQQPSSVDDDNSNNNPSSHEISSLSEYHLLNYDNESQVLSMFDHGLYDGIKRVIFGGANHHWLNRVLLLDAVEHLSSGRIIGPLDRYIQIDIDDIFVGERGKRMNRSDVDNLVETQARFAQRIDGGFKFNLGFSGNYFKHGHENENMGDQQLVSRAQEFDWFCHTWSHSKAHLSNSTQSIASELKKNLKFAREHGLPIIGYDGININSIKDDETLPPTYAIAPHHSGVYPIHDQLYEAWRDVLNVQVTSTEEYPRLRPANGRRAFVHKTIKVLPRQTCGLYTHTIYRNKYPGGISKLEASIRGGELFETILHNPVNIYMTHMSNYANDRLAPYTFSALLDFVQTNTNLQLKYAASNSNLLGPSKLADLYFNIYPNERQPLWTNPCNDKRHLAIWAPEKFKYCSIVPKLLIVGPQKTGTTALYSYLKMNSLFRSSQISSIDFEEVQFFNDKHYYEGVDWYFSRFSPADGDNNAIIDTEQAYDRNATNERRDHLGDSYYYFDKSATYFDDPKVPQRANYLLPEAYIVILLVNPADRAYSWYQHIKAHGDAIANSMSFEQIITSNDGAADVNAAVRSLRNRCLHPGYYSQHLTKWLEHYPSRQIIIIDGQWFRHNPGSVMNRLQLLLRVNQPLDYSKFLVYDEQKGFYCQRLANKVKCLGTSKGRKYAPMSQDARLFLNRHYWPYNRQLARILSDIGQPLPTWLDDAAMSVGHVSSVIY